MTDRKLKMSEALDMHSALCALDGFTKAVGEGSKAAVIFETYKFPARVKLNIARNIGRLVEIKQAYERAYEMTRAEVCPEEKEPEKMAKNTALMAKVKDLLDQDVSVDLEDISPDELNLEVNPIPNTVLHVLMPLIEPSGGRS